MVDLTVLILTKNEEQNLRKCVESFRGVAKRFVIVDSFSTDGTKQVAQSLNTELQEIGSQLEFYENVWIDYATQFNWGLKNTSISTKWTMRMDADEELLEELAKEIGTKLTDLPEDVSGVILKRRVYFLGRWIKHGGRYPEKLLRIFRTGQAICEQKIMDEHLLLKEGHTVEFKNDLVDNNTKDLDWWIGKHNWYSNREVLDYQLTIGKMSKEAGNRSDEQRSLLDHAVSSKQAKRKRMIKNHGYYSLPKFFRSHLYFIYRYYIRFGFLDGKEGKIFHFLQAYWYRFLVDAKMYECEKFGRRMKEQGDLK